MTLTDHERVVAWQAASLLLDYPDAAMLGRRDLVRTATAGLPDVVRRPLHVFLDHLQAASPTELAEDYVATFDHRRRCCLYLTYYSYGDTRKRGMALLRLKQAFRAAGVSLAADELPDHLGVVLEFAATADPVVGRRLLQENRAGIELLRLALRDAGSPYTSILEAVSATLPPLAVRESDAVRRLTAEGPPAEEVGLEPFAPPEYMPVRGPASISGAHR